MGSQPQTSNIFFRMGREAPNVIITAMPEVGHAMPMIQIASYLVRRGYPVFFCGGPQFEDQIRASGAEYYECPNYVTPELSAKLRAMPEGEERHIWAMKHILIDATPVRLKAITTCMEDVRRRFPDREVVLVDESLFLGTMPLWFGAPLPKGYDRLPKIVGINTTFVVNYSVDVAPFMRGLPPAESTEDRERILDLYRQQEPGAREVCGHTNTVLKNLGAVREVRAPWMIDEKMLANDVLLVSCSESLDLHRSDLSPKIKYCGGLPPKDLDPKLCYPDWWSDILANAVMPAGDPGKKRVVVVTQGTVRRQYEHMLLPALEALKDRKDVITIALLGARGAALPEDVVVPENARVIDYLPYDAILPYADAMVTNGGFGGFMHGVMHGVPMVFAGTTEDKAEVALRGERAGLGINLKTSTPTAEMVRLASDRILFDGSYKARALELKKENEEMDFLGSVEQWIWTLLLDVSN